MFGHLDLKGPRYRSSSPLDPLLAGLLSVFIVTTAVVFVILFLKFRQRTNHPEFHRLQDLPMVGYTFIYTYMHYNTVWLLKIPSLVLFKYLKGHYSLLVLRSTTPHVKTDVCLRWL